LSNAIKFTPSDGSITVSCIAGSSVAKIQVADTGRGIPQEKQSSVFEPFVQIERTMGALHEGVGLGLAISQDLARRMGGDLSLQSTVGEGSIFTLTLPTADPI
jgi:signal transduction histidine kinase